MSRVKGGKIAIAYTVWSRKRGAGKEIINKIREWIIEKQYKRLNDYNDIKLDSSILARNLE